MKSLSITNPADFGQVAVLMGGCAAERDISLKSGQAVYQALLRLGVQAVAVDVQASLVKALQGLNVDRIFNVMHGRGGEDGTLQAILNEMALPYTGSGVMASALSMDKLRTKLCWQGMGLTTPAWAVLNNSDDIERCVEQLGFPVIVKPALEGSSIGMSKASNRQELIESQAEAKRFGCDVYAEKWIEGDEYTVGILAGEALPVIRLQTPNVFYDFAAKYTANTTQYHCPCGLPTETEKRLQRLAESACSGLGVAGWARVDAFIDHDNTMQLIEVNTVPGMTDHSLVPMAAKAVGIDFDELVWRILETSDVE